MTSRHRKWALPALITVGTAGLLAGGFIGYLRAGVYNIGADDPHYPITHSLLGQLRDASIERRASALTVPKDLSSPARITQGAGNYNAMCTGCHLAPGMPPTELSRGLYPAPPNLSHTVVAADKAFWTIKHGIKASGMPAWGASMADDYIWNMAAFLQQLPKLDAASYHAMVARSGGHSHGGGESGEQAPHHHDSAMGDMAMPDTMHGDAEQQPHEHAHPAAGTAPAPHEHAPGTPAHDDAPAPHVDPPGAPPHHHDTPATPTPTH